MTSGYGGSAEGENAWFMGTDTGPVDCSGQITSTFTWQAAYPGELPPQKVIVDETSAAGYGLTDIAYYDIDWPAYGDCNDGFNDPAADYYPSGSPFTCRLSSGAHYHVQDGGQTVIVQCSPSASCAIDDGVDEWLCWVAYNVNVYPVAIDLSGVTPAPNKSHPAVLTGQQVTANLNLGGAPGTVSSYQWSVGGDTFETYDTTAPNAQHTTQLVPLSADDEVQPQFSFYDKKQENISVSCTATFTPTGGTALTLIPQSQSISVFKPTVSWTVGKAYADLQEGFIKDATQFGVEELWGPIRISEPSLFTNNDSPNSVGTGILVQIAAPHLDNSGELIYDGYTEDFNKIEVLYPNGTTGAESAPLGLDGSYPYSYGEYIDDNGQWVVSGPTHSPNGDVYNAGYGWLADSVGYSGDTPKQSYAQPETNAYWYKADASESFETWVMYRPASTSGQGTVYVPLQKLSWSWGGSAILDPIADLWNVTQIQPLVPGSPSDTDTPPAWDLTIPLNPTLGP